MVQQIPNPINDFHIQVTLKALKYKIFGALTIFWLGLHAKAVNEAFT